MGEHLPQRGQGNVAARFQSCQLPALDPCELREPFLTQPEVLPGLFDGFMEKHAAQILAQIAHLMTQFRLTPLKVGTTLMRIYAL
jgi:hypothetical protein